MTHRTRMRAVAGSMLVTTLVACTLGETPPETAPEASGGGGQAPTTPETPVVPGLPPGTGGNEGDGCSDCNTQQSQQGSPIPDGDVTLEVSEGCHYAIEVETLSAERMATLGIESATDGAELTV